MYYSKNEEFYYRDNEQKRPQSLTHGKFGGIETEKRKH